MHAFSVEGEAHTLTLSHFALTQPRPMVTSFRCCIRWKRGCVVTTTTLNCTMRTVHVGSPQSNIEIDSNDSLFFLRKTRVKNLFAVEGVNADCRLPTGHSYFYLVIVLQQVNIINLVHTCLRTHNAKRGGRQL